MRETRRDGMGRDSSRAVQGLPQTHRAVAMLPWASRSRSLLPEAPRWPGDTQDPGATMPRVRLLQKGAGDGN